MFNLFDPKNRKFILACAGGGLAIIYLGSFIFTGLSNRSREIDKEIKLAEARLQRNFEIAKIKDNVISDYEKYHPYLTTNNKASQEIMEELLREVESAAKDSGVSVISLSPQPFSEGSKERRTFRGNLRIEGGPQKILDFIYQIQENKLLIKINRMSLVTKDEKATQLRAEMVVELCVE